MDDAKSTAAEAVWTAAASAMAWTAAIHGNAAEEERRRAWAAKYESDNAAKRAAEACARTVDRQGRADEDAIGQVVEGLRYAAEALERASEAFERSSELCEAAGDEQRRAARAHERAADPKLGALMDDQAVGSYMQAQAAARQALRMTGGARAHLRDAGRLEADAAQRSGAAHEWAGDRNALSLVQADMWEDAKEARLDSTAMKGQLEEAEQRTTDLLNLTAATAKMAAAGAAEAIMRGQGDPEVQRAAEAWREAMVAAKKARAEGGSDR